MRTIVRSSGGRNNRLWCRGIRARDSDLRRMLYTPPMTNLRQAITCLSRLLEASELDLLESLAPDASISDICSAVRSAAAKAFEPHLVGLTKDHSGQLSVWIKYEDFEAWYQDFGPGWKRRFASDIKTSLNSTMETANLVLAQVTGWRHVTYHGSSLFTPKVQQDNPYVRWVDYGEEDEIFLEVRHWGGKFGAFPAPTGSRK